MSDAGGKNGSVVVTRRGAWPLCGARAGLAALWLLVASVADAATAEAWFQLAKGGAYRPPQPHELTTAERLFDLALAGRLEPGEWQAAGFEVDSQAGYWRIREQRGERHGRGSWWIHQHGGNRIALLAPHRFSDRHTGQIALLMAGESAWSVVAWNSVSRNDGGDDPASGADLAHSEQSWHMALANAFARRHPAGRLVQIHGFANHKRRSEAAAGSDLIVSDGTGRGSRPISALAECLAAAGMGVVRHYPEQVGELGGTTNEVGRGLRRNGFAGFLHLEFDPGLRLGLVREQPLRGGLARCIELMLEGAG